MADTCLSATQMARGGTTQDVLLTGTQQSAFNRQAVAARDAAAAGALYALTVWRQLGLVWTTGELRLGWGLGTLLEPTYLPRHVHVPVSFGFSRKLMCVVVGAVGVRCCTIHA